jgi:hypothetical protein
MCDAVTTFISTQQGDSPDFIEEARALAVGVALNYEPARLYVVRIDNWFGPRWLHFAGKAVGAFGVHSAELHMPPFVPDRVLAERKFLGPKFEETALNSPLHLKIPGSRALSRRLADLDKDAAFVWFSGQSEGQGRGAVMVYLPDVSSSDLTENQSSSRTEAFYVGFCRKDVGWDASMLVGLSRREVAHLKERGRTRIQSRVLKA